MPLGELDAAQSRVQVRVGGVLADRLVQLGRRAREVLVLQQRVGTREPLPQPVRGGLERAPEVRMRIVPLPPVQLFQPREKVLRLVERGFARQLAQGLERLAQESLAGVELRPLDARRDVSRVDLERPVECFAGLAAALEKEQHARAPVVQVGVRGSKLERAPQRCSRGLELAGRLRDARNFGEGGGCRFTVGPRAEALVPDARHRVREASFACEPQGGLEAVARRFRWTRAHEGRARRGRVRRVIRASR